MQINTKNPFPLEYTIGGKQTKYNGKSKNNEVENYKFFFSSTLTDPDKPNTQSWWRTQLLFTNNHIHH